MTDRELLERAAKAAGFVGAEWRDMTGWGEVRHGYSHAIWAPSIESYWNPLEDDGDALRLAVKLCLFVIVEGNQEGDQQKRTKAGHSGIGSKCELHRADPYAATRRAIVRAAAAMTEKDFERLDSKSEDV